MRYERATHIFYLPSCPGVPNVEIFALGNSYIATQHLETTLFFRRRDGKRASDSRACGGGAVCGARGVRGGLWCDQHVQTIYPDVVAPLVYASSLTEWLDHRYFYPGNAGSIPDVSLIFLPQIRMPLLPGAHHSAAVPYFAAHLFVPPPFCSFFLVTRVHACPNAPFPARVAPGEHATPVFVQYGVGCVCVLVLCWCQEAPKLVEPRPDSGPGTVGSVLRADILMTGYLFFTCAIFFLDMPFAG